MSILLTLFWYFFYILSFYSSDIYIGISEGLYSLYSSNSKSVDNEGESGMSDYWVPNIPYWKLWFDSSNGNVTSCI